MATEEKKSIEISYKANIKDLVSKLEQIPNVTKEEAKKMVAALDRQLKQAEKAAAKSAAAQKKVAREMAAAAMSHQSIFVSLRDGIEILRLKGPMAVDLRSETVVIGTSLSALEYARKTNSIILFNNEPSFFSLRKLENGDFEHERWQTTASSLSFDGLNPYAIVTGKRL